MRKPKQRQSALTFILLSLVPYTEPNIMLAFKPNKFFNELEKIGKYKKANLQRAYNRGIEKDLISKDGILTVKGLGLVKPFVAKKLSKNSRLMVAFDIPEEFSILRQRFRRTLKAWQFKQEQKSVWSTDKDYKDLLIDVIHELNIEKYVEIYEYFRLFPK